MDRLSLICNNLNDYVLEHQSVQSNPELKNKVESALDQLYECYQEAGQQCFNNEIGVYSKRDLETMMKGIENPPQSNEQLKKGVETFKEKQRRMLIEIMRGDEELGLYDEFRKDAYLAGFKNSAEGYNGEHPFEGDSDKKIWDSISEDYEKWLDEQ